MVHAAIRRLRRQGIEQFYLLPYAPEPNATDVLFGVLKHHDLPERTYLALNWLTTVVDSAFARGVPPHAGMCIETMASTSFHNSA